MKTEKLTGLPVKLLDEMSLVLHNHLIEALPATVAGMPFTVLHEGQCEGRIGTFIAEEGGPKFTVVVMLEEDLKALRQA